MRSALRIGLLLLALAPVDAALAQQAPGARWVTPQDTNNGKGCLQACAARGLMPVVASVRDNSTKTPYFLCIGDTGAKKGGERPGYNVVATGDGDATCMVVNLPETGPAEAVLATEFKCLCSNQLLFPIDGSSP